MVKDECDIIKDWIIYHGSIFGFQNLHIIDNYSTDGTYEIIQSFKHLIYSYRFPDYKKKGIYMTELIRTHCKNEFAIPLDIDEFIVLFDKNNGTIRAKKEEILDCFSRLPPYRLYKMDYINSHTNKSENIRDTTHGEYHSLGNVSKVFFHTHLFHDTLDHGNHFMSDDYRVSEICLIHFHTRNLNQIQKKIRNNIIGLGYPDDLQSLQSLIQNNPSIAGGHHIQAQIAIYEKRYVLHDFVRHDHFISLQPFTNEIKQLQLDFSVF